MSDDKTTPLTPSRMGLPPERTGIQLLRSGDVIANRYRIVDLLGEGGMGEVYEAEDLELHERVALKTLISSLQRDERAMSRFRREVQLARKVTHPNVCRIFDVGRHDLPHGASLLFVTMELLRGQTLSDYIRAKAPLAADEVILIVRQLCDGLEAAHTAGVIHRDFKSSNVILAGTPESGATRAVVTDFGLARLTGDSSESSQLSSAGNIIGTPAYMAPEQIEGKNVSAATDIYALGVVMYEMITGTFPFAGDTISSLVRRLNEEAPPPRLHQPGIDPRIEAVVMRCLERRPEDRFFRAAEIPPALRGETVVMSVRRRRQPWGIMAAILAVAVVIGALFVFTDRREATPQSEPLETARSVRPSVAVLGFKNLSGKGESAWLSTALAEMLATELAAGDRIRTIPGEEVTRAKSDLRLTDVETHAADTLARIRSAVGAEYVVLGSFLTLADPAGSRLRVDLRVQNTERGETVAAFTQTGRESDLFSIVDAAGEELRRHITGEPLSATTDARRALPGNTAAARLYAEGVTRLRSWDARGAREQLEKAVAADPDFALAHMQLSNAYAILGYDAKAAEHAQQALASSTPLSRSERLLIEANHHHRAGDVARAVELYRSLTILFPDDPEHRFRYLNTLIESSNGQEALKVIAEIRGGGGSAASDPRLDLLESWAAEVTGDMEHILTAADRAIANARKRGNREVLAEALVMRGWALANFARDAEAEPAFDDGESLFNQIGNRAGVAKALRKRSFIDWRRGDFQGSRSLSERALRIYEEIGQKQGAANAMGGIGVVLNQQGKHTEARALFENALRTYREIGDRQNTAWALSSIAGTYVMQNDFATGIRFYEQALDLSRRVGDRGEVAITLANLGQTSLTLGDLKTAEKRLLEARSLFMSAKDRSSAAYVESTLADLSFARGDLRSARVRHEFALREREALEEMPVAAENQYGLALISLEERNPGAAIAFAAAAAAAWGEQERTDKEALALGVLARAHLENNNVAEAEKALARARELAKQSEDAGTAVQLALVESRLAIARGEHAAAVRLTQEAMTRAKKLAIPELRFEAQYVSALADLARGRNEESKKKLTALKEAAEAKGYLLIANRASSHLRGSIWSAPVPGVLFCISSESLISEGQGGETASEVHGPADG